MLFFPSLFRVVELGLSARESVHSFPDLPAKFSFFLRSEETLYEIFCFILLLLLLL